MELDTQILNAIGPLRAAGFALHWLHPRKKNPIGAEWQNAPVATLDDLRRTHVRGNNLGVRLGEPSRVGGYYLQAIDLDIRHADLADEAWDAFAEILPGIDPNSLPCVASGSGGESRHLYFVTDRPFHGKKLAVSEGKHRGRDGKWHYDWEIELFGTGKQVAMPPSIHPDSGKPYLWVRPFDFDMLDLGDAPYIPAEVVEALGAAETGTYEFETREPLTFKPGQLEAELDMLPVWRLDDRTDWITLGQALHHQFGGSDEGFELWMLHSARSEHYLVNSSRKAELRRYRGFGKNRRKPVTMASVRLWVQEERVAALRGDAFDEEDEEPETAAAEAGDLADDFDDLFGGNVDAGSGDQPVKPEPTAAAVDPFDEIENTPVARPAADWLSLLHFNEEGVIKPTLHNLRLIVENDTWTCGVAAFNEFTQEIVQRGAPGTKPSRRKNAAKVTLQLTGSSWVLHDRVNGDFWTEDKDNAIRALIEAPETQGGYGIKVPDRDLRAAIDIAGRKNSFHPVREYLSRLKWDGKPRAERLFIQYLGSPDDAYTRNVGRLMLIAGVTRIFEPGHKFDFAVILEGLQGKRKSTFISTLARNWFAELDGDFEDQKQMVELMQGAWLLEIPELSGFARADVRHIKAFMSRRSDKVRLAYARRAQEYPRQCIFIGSTNDDKYLKDDTGARRYWPVRCQVDEIDTEGLDSQADQIWAEAVHLYNEMRAKQPRGTLPLYLADRESQNLAARLQESRRVESADDAVAGQIAAWLDKPINDGGFDDEDVDGNPRYRDQTCLIEIWVDCLGKDKATYKQAEAQLLGRAMSLIPEWKAEGSFYLHQRYGKQRLYERFGILGRLERMTAKTD